MFYCVTKGIFEISLAPLSIFKAFFKNVSSDDTCTGDGDVESLQEIYEGLLNRVRAARKCLLAELLSAINSSEFTLSRISRWSILFQIMPVDGRRSFSL